MVQVLVLVPVGVQGRGPLQQPAFSSFPPRGPVGRRPRQRGAVGGRRGPAVDDDRVLVPRADVPGLLGGALVRGCGAGRLGDDAGARFGWGGRSQRRQLVRPP